jgi:hypothetical protein
MLAWIAACVALGVMVMNLLRSLTASQGCSP